ncbi:MAG: hypothetical protein JRI96_15530 [Deltaproteobacteria bacterium]|nr:hypothetical protein [Deltaproteobacteria bacterium]
MKSRPFVYKIIEDYFTGVSKRADVGNSVRIEASSICQLQCPACSTGNGRMGVVGKGYLKFRDFKKFVDGYPMIKTIELSNYGEIFLNPELKGIIFFTILLESLL